MGGEELLSAVVPALGAVGAGLAAYNLKQQTLPYGKGGNTGSLYDDVLSKQNTNGMNDIAFETALKKRHDSKKERDKYTRLVKFNKSRNKKNSTSDKAADESCLDSHLLQTQHNQRLTALQMKIGRSLYSTSAVDNFLANLCGTGTVKTSWSGSITYLLGQRLCFYECFRHRFSADISNTVSGAFPYTYNNEILFPNVGATASHPPNPMNPPPTLNNPAAVHQDKYQYFAPINRADFEDMSWNLNALKLGPNGYVAPTTVDVGTAMAKLFQAQTPLFMPDKHRRQSTMQQNNQLVAPKFVATAGTESTYKYNMVFNSGTVSYTFLNKGIVGSKVVVVVYRLKKTHKASAAAASYSTPTYVHALVSNARAQGYVDTVSDKMGTEDLGGREPLLSDVVGNPDYPFLPDFKKTREMYNDFSEVMRNTFAMPAGGRRTVNVVLPGDIYDPSDIAAMKADPVVDLPGASTPPVGSQPILDHHSYVIAIAVHGEKVTRNFHQDAGLWVATDGGSASYFGPDDVPYFDCYAPGELQYYAEYSENISACEYKKPNLKRISVNGVRRDPYITSSFGTITQGWKEEAAIIIPARDAVRQTRQESTVTNTADAASTVAGKITQLTSSNPKGPTARGSIMTV